jgi:hypothetical protein
VQLCQASRQVIDKQAATSETQEIPGSLLPENAPTENLLKTLADTMAHSRGSMPAMQDIVDILREREVSWVIIGQALAVSRGSVEAVRMKLTSPEKSGRHRRVPESLKADPEFVRLLDQAADIVADDLTKYLVDLRVSALATHMITELGLYH